MDNQSGIRPHLMAKGSLSFNFVLELLSQPLDPSICCPVYPVLTYQNFPLIDIKSPNMCNSHVRRQCGYFTIVTIWPKSQTRHPKGYHRKNTAFQPKTLTDDTMWSKKRSIKVFKRGNLGFTLKLNLNLEKRASHGSHNLQTGFIL